MHRVAVWCRVAVSCGGVVWRGVYSARGVAVRRGSAEERGRHVRPERYSQDTLPPESPNYLLGLCLDVFPESVSISGLEIWLLAYAY